MTDTIAQRKARGYERLASERDAAQTENATLKAGIEIQAREIERLNDAVAKHPAAIAAAVQAEREACAKVAEAFEVEASYRLKHHAVTAEAKQQRSAQMDASSSIAAAIRARNGAGRK